ncbi:OLC1v1023670C1 [Oldenlandia corymbosa var. corymbosa]|uniref:OLC1v1023670C1 n=1 Tax=Oldenlandia corymbosa var. corymbosa TaxID=529605 RepID=A0AAV1C0I7_OLDCO|nr:OLC1v1023670C1 [Oldenlandia corymbosa var. corymbosa]
MGSLAGGGKWGPFGMGPHSFHEFDSRRRRRRSGGGSKSANSGGVVGGIGYRFPVKQAVTAAALALTGDTIAQLRQRWVDNKDSVSDDQQTKDVLEVLFSGHDWIRALRLTTYAFLLYGPGSYAWYQFLERRMPEQTFGNLLSKVVLNQIVLGPAVIAVIFAWNNIWQGKVSELPKKYQTDALPTLLFGFRFWIPVSILNFWLVPLPARVAFMSTGSIFWNFYLSSTMNNKRFWSGVSQQREQAWPYSIFNSSRWAGRPTLNLDSMNRGNQNITTPGNWRSRPDNGPYPPRQDVVNRMPSSIFPLHPPVGGLLDPREDIHPWWLLRERLPGGPVIIGSLPVQPYLNNQNQYLGNSATRIPSTRQPAADGSPSYYGQWNVQARNEEQSKLTPDEQKKVLSKLKKEVYNPTPKWLTRRPSLYYRDNPLHISRETKSDKDDDGKRCAICLEDFEPKELVTVTPCNHMFHEECIVPWVKNQGQCPVCRFAILEKAKENAAPSRNVVTNDPFENELITMMRALEQAYLLDNIRRKYTCCVDCYHGRIEKLKAPDGCLLRSQPSAPANTNLIVYKLFDPAFLCFSCIPFQGNVVSPICVLPLTEENVEKVLDEVRPSLMADGGNVALHEIDGLVVVLKLQGACGSCPSSAMTLKMGIETRLRDKIPEILEVEQIVDTETGLELNEENVEKVLSEIRPYLAGTGGGELGLVQIDDYVVKVRLSGPAAGVMTVRVALTQKLREKIPAIAAVQLIE